MIFQFTDGGLAQGNHTYPKKFTNVFGANITPTTNENAYVHTLANDSILFASASASNYVFVWGT